MPEIHYPQDTETTFKIQAYGRMGLAKVYLPNLHPRSVHRKLRHWMTIYLNLPGCLLSLGYHEGERIYLPVMVRAIIESLGEP